MLFIALITFIVFIYLTYRNPLLALATLCALLPTYLLRFEISVPFEALAKNGGIPFTILEIIIWAIFFGWFFSLLWKNASSTSTLWKRGVRGDLIILKKRLQFIKWPLAIFFVASIIAIFISPEKLSALGVWRAYFLESIITFLLLLAIIKNKNDFKKIVFGLSIPALYISLYAIAQRFFGAPIPYPWQNELRITSIFEYPNAVGLFLAPIIILIVGQIISNPKFKSLTNYYLLLATILSLLAIIFAKSDGAIFSVIGAGILFILLNLFFNKKYKSGVVILLLVFLAGGLLFSVLEMAQEKIMLQDWSGFVRLTIWGETWNMLRNNWFFGAGLSGYQTAIIPFHESRDWMEIFLYPHNIILNFWSELGLIGLASFLWLLEKFGKVCYTSIKSSPLWKRGVRGDLIFMITAICAMSALLIHGLVDVPYFKNDLSILFWIIYSMPIILSSHN
ncbi:O-antigen ligase family protein [Patescibacteria group bacterium]|nr:O-antigen ligase family protein [Patescibacteria group bacterium]